MISEQKLFHLGIMAAERSINIGIYITSNCCLRWTWGLAFFINLFLSSFHIHAFIRVKLNGEKICLDNCKWMEKSNQQKSALCDIIFCNLVIFECWFVDCGNAWHIYVFHYGSIRSFIWFGSEIRFILRYSHMKRPASHFGTWTLTHTHTHRNTCENLYIYRHECIWQWFSELLAKQPQNL